ncbi:TylF/MycF/NovP-related O-methyltransferase [Actinoplanes sp. NPDC049316]|uniref:TylF/MycF/NovP-related O-methyltransferase n=1 Tax=Actinoplanes sp. NPDC049316 TaxID=3154727 RepID=UPI00343DC51C
MRPEDFTKLADDVEAELLHGAMSVAILGATPTALRLLERLASTGLDRCVHGIYTATPPAAALHAPTRSLEDLVDHPIDVIAVAADADKEDLLTGALPFIQGAPKVVVAGYGHLAYRDPGYRQELDDLLVPSLANGYPNSLVHLHQCLTNAALLGLQGVVAEFGMFKGGTTMFLSRTIERLGADWPVIGFDTFAGFPARRSPLDMYDHPDCVFTDIDSVRRYLAHRRVEIVPGDIAATASRLASEDLVCTFIDTDNYTPASAAVTVVQERTLVGGAIVFDHVTGVDRFRYTLGERMAARPLLSDSRYFHLHGTGVFYRQR